MNSNLAKKAAHVAEVVVEPVMPADVAAPVLTIVKDQTEEKPEEIQAPVPFIAPWATAPEVKEEPRKLSLEEKIQRVEDLTLLIERFRALAESRRKLQTFQIGSDSLSSTILLRDASGNEFKTSNSAVITSVIDEMKRTLDAKVREVETLINF